VKFDAIKHVDVKRSEDKKMPQINIALTDGTMAISYVPRWKLQRPPDFGDFELPASRLRKVPFG
jgi:hypothetical protein